jgi:CO/xanthine dehydrogenase FAD-binding subunit
MKPPPFEYHAPATVADALTHVDRYQDSGKILAGGQSLVPLLNMRLAHPDHLVDLNRIEGLAAIEEDADRFTVGAMTRQRAVERSPDIARRHPLLTEAMSYVAHPQIRNRGTIGGTLCHADPAAELPAVSLAVDAALRIQSVDGARTVPASDFFVSHFTTTLGPNELVTGVTFPKLRGRTGWSIQEIARRHGDFALVGVVAVVEMVNGRVADARLVLFAAGERPLRMGQAEKILVQAEPDTDVVGEAAATVAREVSPPSDMHASAEGRRRMASALTSRALHQAVARAREVS